MCNAQTCDALLAHGVFDISKLVYDRSSAYSYMHWFCDEHFGSQEVSDKFGGSIGLPFQGLAIKLGFDSSKESWQTWYSKTCSSTQIGTTDSLSVNQYIQSVSSTLVKAFTDCIQADGFHVWLERSSGRDFRIAAVLRDPTDQGASALIDTLSLPANVKCPGARDFVRHAVRGSTRRLACTRTDDASVDITLNASWDPRGGGALSLPEVWQRPETPEAPTTAKAKCYVDIGKGTIDGPKSGTKHLHGVFCTAPGKITSTLEEVSVEMTDWKTAPCLHAERYRPNESIQGNTAYIKFFTDSGDKCEVQIVVEYELPRSQAAASAPIVSATKRPAARQALPVVIRRVGA
jgi:hypothetical protein